MMNDRKKWILDILLLLLVASLTLYAVLRGQNPQKLYLVLEMADGRYWAAAVLLVFPFVFSESLILYLLLRHVGEKVNGRHCLIYSAIGFFFSCITPAAGGGQPLQVYYMRKDGLDPGTTTPLLMIVTIFYKLVLVLAGILLFLIKPSVLRAADSAVLWWAFAGWCANVVVVSLFAMLVICPDPLENLCLTVLGWASGRRISQERVSGWRNRVEHSFARYREASQYMRSSGKLLLVVLLISVIQRAILFSVTWLVIRSFHILNAVSPVEIILLQAMVSMGTDLIPLPGGSGANEAMFLMLFGDLVGEIWAVPALIASRGISYYGQILICGAIVLIFGRFLGRKRVDR